MSIDAEITAAHRVWLASQSTEDLERLISIIRRHDLEFCQFGIKHHEIGGYNEELGCFDHESAYCMRCKARYEQCDVSDEHGRCILTKDHVAFGVDYWHRGPTTRPNAWMMGRLRGWSVKEEVAS